MATKTPIEPGIIQRAIQGARYALTGMPPNVWMGPQQPILPVAPESTAGRQFDYPVGINTRFTPKTTEGNGVSYAQLRALADSLDILRIVIETRKDQIATMDWKLVAKKDKKVSEQTLAELELRFKQPTPEYDWDMWLRMILEDLFVVDAVSIYPRMTRGGGLYSLDLIDATTIKRVIDEGGRTPIAPDPAYQQILKGIPAVDYTTDELIFRVRNPRTNRMYGCSPVEQIIMTVNIALRRQLSQLQYFTEGNIPEALVSVPDTWNPDQVAAFQLYFDSILSGNTAERSRLRFVPVDTSKIKETKNPDLKDVFDEWLARIVCFCFSISPTPFIKETNRATAASQAERSLEEGLKPTLTWVKRLMDYIILTRLGNADVEFSWEQPEAIDPMDQAKIDQIYVTANIRSAAEIRADRGWEGAPPEPPAPPPVVATKQPEGEQNETMA